MLPASKFRLLRVAPGCLLSVLLLTLVSILVTPRLLTDPQHTKQVPVGIRPDSRADQMFVTEQFPKSGDSEGKKNGHDPQNSIINSSVVNPAVFETFNESFLVKTISCKIPNLNPFHLSVSKEVLDVGPIRCHGNASVVYQDKTVLKMNWTAAKKPPYNGRIDYCMLIPLLPNDEQFLSSRPVKHRFNESVKMETEFAQINCYDSDKKLMYLNFHATIQTNKTLDQILKNRYREHVEKYKIRHLNVLLIGIDSLSRLSFIRQMNKTRAFLEKKLGAYNLMGFNKVADNTLVNFVPSFLGKFLSEIPWNTNKTFDEYNFIWKQYSKKGYHTFFAEDAPQMSAFDYGKLGFDSPPADHFYRPLSLVKDWHRKQWQNENACFQDKLEMEFILNYTHDFVETYKNAPHFGLSFFSTLTHDDQNGPGPIDEYLHSFFQRLHSSHLLNNTVLFFFSDHGMRYGKVRNTFIGKFEERIPFVYVVVPSWFRKSHQQVLYNLRLNQNKLTSNFDMYETLQDILYFNGEIKSSAVNSRGLSWFREIPETRSCASAGIADHWCTCLQREKLKTNGGMAEKVSQSVLAYINNKVAKYNSCAELSIYIIKEVERMFASDELVLGSNGKLSVDKYTLAIKQKRQKSFESIQVVIETIPGHGVFEATAHADLNSGNILLDGDISRVNKYFNQSHCINDFQMEKFCYCKDNL